MRYAVFFAFLLLLPGMAMAQGKGHRAAIAQFVQCYNNLDAAGMSTLFSSRSADKNRYTRAHLAQLHNRFRNIKSFSFARQREDGLIIYTVKFVKPHYNDPTFIPNAWVGVYLDKKANGDDKDKVLKLKFPTSAYLDGGERYFLMVQ